MIKLPFMEALEAQLRPEERIFKLRSAELVDDVLHVELLLSYVDYDSLLNADLQNKVKAIIDGIIPGSFTCYVRFVKACNEENSVITHFLEYIYKEKPTVFSGFQDAPIEVIYDGKVLKINVTLEKYIYEYAVNAGLKKETEDYMSMWVMEDAEVNFFEVPYTEEKIVFARPQTRSNSIKTVEVEIIGYYVGNIAQNPRYIVDIKDRENPQACLCGVVSDVKKKYIEKLDKDLFTFRINDTTATIKVKYFAKAVKRVNWDEVFSEGQTLCMQGQIKYDNYDAGFTFSPRSIAKCKINYASINVKKEFLPEPENYVYIKPKSISTGMQSGLFDAQPNPDLLGKEFVVFDLETTGLDAAQDRIIEIAAVKIRKGEICESFECLVNPKMALPEEIVKLTNITDEMLENCYGIEDVLGDFYKFTRNSILVAHNAPFDVGFITVAGEAVGYDFDNTYMDTLAMSRRSLKLKNHKLATVCAHFKIPLIGAHRAINDTIATAQVFINLMNMS